MDRRAEKQICSSSRSVVDDYFEVEMAVMNEKRMRFVHNLSEIEKGEMARSGPLQDFEFLTMQGIPSPTASEESYGPFNPFFQGADHSVKDIIRTLNTASSISESFSRTCSFASSNSENFSEDPPITKTLQPDNRSQKDYMYQSPIYDLRLYSMANKVFGCGEQKQAVDITFTPILPTTGLRFTDAAHMVEDKSGC